jgi:acyl carrier protein
MSAALSLESIQRMFIEIWSEVLGVKVQPGDDFFDLGGDSIAGVQVMFRASELIGLEVSPTVIYAHTTIEDLAAEVERLLADGARA